MSVIFNSFDNFNNMLKRTNVDEATLILMSKYQTFYSAIRNQQYVTTGSKLGCTSGSQLSYINNSLDYGISVENGRAVLTNADNFVGKFGTCSSQGNAKIHLCMPNVIGYWQTKNREHNTYIWVEDRETKDESGEEKIEEIKYYKVLTDDAFLPCSNGGCISVLEVPGQYGDNYTWYNSNNHKVDARALQLMEDLYDKYPSVREQYDTEGMCIFGLEGLGWLGGKGNSTLYPNGRYGAMMVVTIGKKVEFVSYHASTLPGKLRENSRGTAIVDEGCYSLYGKRHQGYYGAFGTRTESGSGNLPVKRAHLTKDILLEFEDDGKTRLTADGVNIHTAPDKVGDLYSTACQTMRTTDYIQFLNKTGLVNEGDPMAKKLEGKEITSSIKFRGENAYPKQELKPGEHAWWDESNTPYRRNQYGIKQFSDISEWALTTCENKRTALVIERNEIASKNEGKTVDFIAAEKGYYWYMELLCGMNVNIEDEKGKEIDYGYYVIDRSYMPADQKEAFFMKD